MTDPAAKLFLWLSPSFPVGGFAYSQGLEWAAHDGQVSDAETLTAWLRAQLTAGALKTELVFLSLAHRAAPADLPALAELAAAHHPSAERAQEALLQGAAFRDAYRAAWAPEPRPAGPGSAFDALADAPLSLSLAVALAARDHALPLAPCLEAYAVAQQSNQIAAAIRLGVLGQTAGQQVAAALLPEVLARIPQLAVAAEDDLGGAVFAADIASMRHETQPVRLFRS